jgi:hypothetical protein
MHKQDYTIGFLGASLQELSIQYKQKGTRRSAFIFSFMLHLQQKLC